MPEAEILLLGCGILRKEVQFLVEKNRWPADTCFLDSALHVNFAKLSAALVGALTRHRGRTTLVFYGCCLPLIDQIVAGAGAVRIPGQNCLEMLLGSDQFTEHLAQGAFFLLEDWARRWDQVLMKTFGTNEWVTKEVFRGDRSHLLGLRTPCSGDFRAEATEAGRKVGLPVRWLDVSLDHLEQVLQTAIARRTVETS